MVAALVGLDGGSHSILSIKEEIKLPTPLDRSFGKLFFSYLEELKEHVIKVGGHVHDADRRVLLTCGGNAASLHSCKTFQHHHLQTLRTGPPGAIITSWKGSVNIVRCTWHLATLELQRYN